MLRLTVFSLILSCTFSCERLYAQEDSFFLENAAFSIKQNVEAITKCSFSESYSASFWKEEEKICCPPRFIEAKSHTNNDIVHLVITMPIQGDALVKVWNAKEEICMFSMIELNGNFHTDYELDVSEWQSGAYTVQIEKNGMVSSNKIFVNARY